MIKLLVCSGDAAIAQRVVEGLKAAGAADVDVVDTSEGLKLPARLPRDNRYIFVCQSPAEKLVELTPQVSPAADPENSYAAELTRWYGAQSELLATYEANQARSILTTHSAVVSSFEGLIHQINQRWRQSLTVSTPDPQKITDFPSQTEPMLGYLVQNLIKQTPQLRKMSALIADVTDQEKASFGEVQALEGYRALQLAINQNKAQQQKEKEQLTAQNDTLASEKASVASEKASIEAQLKDSLEEGELILQQLHQVQEELENYFLKCKDAEQKHDSLQKTNADLTAARDTQAKAASERLQQVEVLSKEKTALTTQKQALEKANAELIASRDAQAKAAAERQKQVEVLTQEKTQLTAQKGTLESEKASMEAQLKDSLEEGELILLQLHQVQEELENYFLKYKEAEQKHDGLQYRWRQMLKRYPDYVDYEWVEARAVETKAREAGETKSTDLQWHFKGLESAGISRPSIVFETFVEAGVLGVRFKKSPTKSSGVDDHGDDENAESSLMRWPEVAKDSEDIECIPAGRGEVMALRASVLRDLSSSDWGLLQLIPKIVAQAISERPIEGVDTQAVLSAAKRLSDALSRLPKALRHDSIVLKKHQVNPDYEHLWFVFHNLRAGERHWPKFEIRLGASNIKPGKFSQHPKIEIPLIDGETKPFDSWFEESTDDFGGKWELRFNLSKNIYDAGVWNELQPDERGLILALLGQLTQETPPTHSSSAEMRRDWSDWQDVFYRCAQLLK